MVLFVVGLIVGIVIGLFLSMIRSDGEIVIDDSDEMTTRWVLDVNTEPERVKEKRSIRLKVRELK
jgi:hypothetical protein